MKRSLQILAGLVLASATGAGLATALEAPPGDPEVVELLSGMSYVPDRETIDGILGATAVEELVQIAEDTSISSDPGVKLRAFRALGEFDENPERTVATAALRRAIASFEPENAGTELLYLRASMLSLARIDGANSVSELVDLLAHPSRDIRAACAQALGITGSDAAIQPLRNRALVETEPQVQLAIADALFRLDP